MLSGLHYSHPRFRDVSFIANQVRFSDGNWRVQAEWFLRGKPMGIVSELELSRKKASELFVKDFFGVSNAA